MGATRIICACIAGTRAWDTGRRAVIAGDAIGLVDLWIAMNAMDAMDAMVVYASVKIAKVFFRLAGAAKYIARPAMCAPSAGFARASRAAMCARSVEFALLATMIRNARDALDA